MDRTQEDRLGQVEVARQSDKVVVIVLGARVVLGEQHDRRWVARMWRRRERVHEGEGEERELGHWGECG